jgi:hypothetical protein
MCTNVVQTPLGALHCSPNVILNRVKRRSGQGVVI